MPPTTRDRILDSAEELVLEHGFSATTIDAVLAKASASKGAFFHHFPSKAHLGRALVERYAAGDADLLESTMAAAEAETDDPADQLLLFLRSFEQTADEVVQAQPSCLLVSFIYEHELEDAGTDKIVARSVLLWRERILDKLEQVAEQRTHLREQDLPALADQVFTIFEGAFLLSRALDDTSAMRRQLSHLRHYLELLFRLP